MASTSAPVPPPTMPADIPVHPNLTRADKLVLENLLGDIRSGRDYEQDEEADEDDEDEDDAFAAEDAADDAATLAALDALNDPAGPGFEPTVFTSWDVALDEKGFWTQSVLRPYVAWAQRHVVRHPTDVVFCTHLLLYFTTIVPSAAVLLFGPRSWYSWMHGAVHALAVVGGCIGGYTIMMHQHIHGGGILQKQGLPAVVDRVFPYLLDPLMGHTWNSYYYHHVKHHHVEGNGPDDLSSTVWFQRDRLADFAQYFGRFFLFAWLDLPRYYLRTRRPGLAARCAFWELSSYALIVGSVWLRGSPAVWALAVPFAVLRVGLMLGNWGQHAFVDPVAPDSDYRSSITLVDVASNRFCFNDGYHTSHHLHPRRHWRLHPRAFLAQKQTYAAEQALVFTGIDYLEISLRLLLFQDYATLAKRLVPLGAAQQAMTLPDKMALLRRCTRRFTDDDIVRAFPASRAAQAIQARRKKAN